ncbi:J domain-containing protein [Acetobacter sp. AN02]|uniref:J domain-containing protein n=1 Tax=Acetobacter sp. AN02 TaxID=2894186 RepID=UPI0024344D98|nr:J domain-containing protein [Acetobacter sp. AN02]MDG6094305.1 J domain-containing protein [Acetobacter sp. AN02]
MSARNPYDILGVGRSASQDEIRKAYRNQARKWHPDLNPGNKEAEEKFKELNTANDILSDEERRGRFDRGEIDESGQERGPFAGAGTGGFGGGFGGFRAGGGSSGGGFSQDDLSDILNGMFGRNAGRRQGGPERGADRPYQISISFMDAVNGTTTRVSLPGGATLDVKIPPGTEDGRTLRLRGKGEPGMRGGPAGDALITVTVMPDRNWTREGQDLRTRLPVGLKTAVLGGPITVPTPSGAVKMNVPEGSDTGSVLRLRGKGVPAHGKHEAGNLYVTLEVTLGRPDEALRAFLKTWDPAGEKTA